MTVLIKLFGDLGEKSRGFKDTSGIPVTLKIKNSRIKTVFDILKLLNIQKSEVSHIFVNGTYSGPGKVVNDGDRIGLFPIRMSLIFLELTKKNTIRLNIGIFQDEKKNISPEFSLDLPEGSTLELVLKKCSIPKTIDKLHILINGEKTQDQNHILKNDDIIIINSPLNDSL
ncbi:MAG: hypothetical protein ACW986_10615 [Promethearchaeota archaeon]|jgi:molybdopterin converting factor small subunit